MKDYLLVIVAVILLAVNFCFQKLYQQKTGTSLEKGLIFSAVSGTVSFLLFFILNGFSLQITPFSLLMSGLMALFCTSYQLIGFRILQSGNMALYTLALMSGGMTVPCLVGVLFLKEKISPLRIAGLIVILAAVIISNSGKTKLNRKQAVLCASVFLLNGGCSVVSKLHQIQTDIPAVSPTVFVLLYSAFSAVLSSVAFPFTPKSVTKQPITFPIVLLISASAVAGSLSYCFQLMGASNLPASVLYPLITGGSILLSSLCGIVFFSEKAEKKVIISILLCFAGTLLFL